MQSQSNQQTGLINTAAFFASMLVATPAGADQLSVAWRGNRAPEVTRFAADQLEALGQITATERTPIGGEEPVWWAAMVAMHSDVAPHIEANDKRLVCVVGEPAADCPKGLPQISLYKLREAAL